MIKNTRFCLILLSLLTVFQVSAAEEANKSLVQPYSICGTTTDWQDVNLYDGTLNVSKAYVDAHKKGTVNITKLGEPDPFDPTGEPRVVSSGTGFLIDHNLILTAAHNLISNNVVVANNTEQSAAIAEVDLSKFSITFGYELLTGGNVSTGRKYLVRRIVEIRQFDELTVSNGETARKRIDFAVLELNSSPGNDFNIARIAQKTPASNETVTIIQHPEGAAKKVHVGITDGYGESFYYGLLRHTVDTLGSSSGSGIIDTEGKTIAIHTKNGCDGGQQANHGLLIEDIANHSPTVLSLMTNNSDDDSLRNDIDNCPRTTNENQMDLDADGFGNVCDIDYIASVLVPIISLLVN